jgi:hypothetical protein
MHLPQRWKRCATQNHQKSTFPAASYAVGCILSPLCGSWSELNETRAERESPGSPPQNEYFNENWISRGVPTTEVIWENELGLSMSVADGLANDG